LRGGRKLEGEGKARKIQVGKKTTGRAEGERICGETSPKGGGLGGEVTKMKRRNQGKKRREQPEKSFRGLSRR